MTNQERALRWPAEPVDLDLAWVDYDVVADEFLVYFGGRPVPAISSPFKAPGFADVAIMLGLQPDGAPTDVVVGIQVIPMLLGAVQERPEWAVLAWAAMAGDFGVELLRERLPVFLAEVRDAVANYWVPAPPIEEQMANLAGAPQRAESARSDEAIDRARTA